MKMYLLEILTVFIAYKVMKSVLIKEENNIEENLEKINKKNNVTDVSQLIIRRINCYQIRIYHQ